MEQKQYPIGLPVRAKKYNVIGIIYDVFNHLADVKLTDGQIVTINISDITPLTEAEYFAQIMKPQGWKYSNVFQSYSISDSEMIYPIAFEVEYFNAPFVDCVNAENGNFDRHLLEKMSSALDHYEALQAIRKYEQL